MRDQRDFKLLDRDNFKKEVFKRDGHRCLFCSLAAVDAHHILERKLFEDGGYYLENGASLCEDHHMQAEQTVLSVEEIRSRAKILKPILPKNFDAKKIYDKWGNEIKEGEIIPGPLFLDQGCQRMLKSCRKIY